MPSTRQYRRQLSLLIVGALVPALIISVPAVISYRAEHELSESVQAVGHTLHVEQLIQRLAIAVLDAESGERGFLLTQRSEDRARFEGRAKEIPALVALLSKKTSDNVAQAQNIGRLKLLVEQRLAVLAEAVSFNAPDATGNATPGARAEVDSTGMSAISSLLEQMSVEEQRLLNQRQEALANRAHFARIVVWTLVALAAGFAILVLWLARRISKARSLAKICAWSNKIELEGQWVTFDQYLSRNFNIDTTHGISPEEAERVRIQEGL
jgi:CHASE3 domain sensor protein